MRWYRTVVDGGKDDKDAAAATATATAADAAADENADDNNDSRSRLRCSVLVEKFE